MADPKIRLKRSSVPGKIPNETQVPLGEIALNTFDGKVFASRNVGIGTTVFVVNPWSVGTGTDAYNTYFTVGNVGIGTTTPTSALDVSGDANVSGVLTATSFYGDGSNLTGITAAGSGVVVKDDGVLSGTATTIDFGSNLSVSFSSGTATITATGGSSSQWVSTNAGIHTLSNVGIGTTNPTSKLDVFGDAKVSGVVTATTFVGALTGTATSTTNIPNLTGDVTSNNTTTTLATVNSNVGTYGDAGAIPSVTVNAKGLVTGVTTVAPNNGQLSLGVSGTGLSGSATFTANQSGSSTFTVTSNATDANAALTIVARDASGNFSAGTITANLTGNASSATYATTAGVSTSVIGGIASVTQLNVETGVSTVGFLTATNIWNAGVTTSSSFVKSGGTSSQFLKADGSVDSSTYLTSYTETDTLNSVTGRGNSTSNGISVGILTATSGNFSGILTSSGAVISGVVTSNGFNATTGNDYKINGTSVLTSTTLGSNVVNSSLTSVGTLGSLNVSGVSTLGVTSITNLTSQQLNVSGITTLAGNINLGDNTADDINVSGEFVSNLIPNTTNTYDLGSSTQKWRDIWSAGTVTANSFSGSGTNLTGIVTSIVAGTNITVSGSTGQVTINSTASGGGGTPLDILEVMLFA